MAIPAENSRSPQTGPGTSVPSLASVKSYCFLSRLNLQGGSLYKIYFLTICQVNEWSMAPPMTMRRSCVGIAELDGIMYALGGYDGYTCLDYMERYDPYMEVGFELSFTSEHCSPSLY